MNVIYFSVTADVAVFVSVIFMNVYVIYLTRLRHLRGTTTRSP